MTNTVNPLELREKELALQIRTLGEELNTVRQTIAESKTDLKVGDRVNYKGELWLLTVIRPGYSDGPKFYGSKIKKDGTPGVSVREMWYIGSENKPVKAKS